MATDIFKLIFEHDLRLEQLANEQDPRRELHRPSTLEEFMKPVQTYSKFYFTGTRLNDADPLDSRFGFSTLQRHEELLEGFRRALMLHSVHTSDGLSRGMEALSADVNSPLAQANQTLLLFPNAASEAAGLKLLEQAEMHEIFSREFSVREKIKLKRPFLDAGAYVLFTEQAHHGVDLHVFSKVNIYEAFFAEYKPLVLPPGEGQGQFRFFSINGKRSKSERLFYFETWSLHRPPHGFEEVFPQTTLR
ncbi:MAG: hypothetical protein ACOC2C_03825 [Cyclonatronaceae bacterium]